MLFGYSTTNTQWGKKSYYKFELNKIYMKWNVALCLESSNSNEVRVLTVSTMMWFCIRVIGHNSFYLFIQFFFVKHEHNKNSNKKIHKINGTNWVHRNKWESRECVNVRIFRGNVRKLKVKLRLWNREMLCDSTPTWRPRTTLYKG